jgi:hypothetical protein
LSLTGQNRPVTVANWGLRSGRSTGAIGMLLFQLSFKRGQHCMSSGTPELYVAPARGISGSRPSFFLAAHVVLLVVVLLGLSPSFFLRSAFHHVTPLSALLYAHGAVLTVWFLITVVQGWLIRAQELRLHRRLGYVAAGYAVIVIVFGTLANLRLISEIDSPDDGENIVVWGNFFTLVMFAAFVSLAIVFRKKPEVHKRLILLASMSIVGPALARFPRWPIFAGGLEAGRTYAIAGLLIMFALLLMYDVVTRKKPHPASWVGMVLILASLGGAVVLGITGIGYHILHG